jgi:hypothetical protein
LFLCASLTKLQSLSVPLTRLIPSQGAEVCITAREAVRRRAAQLIESFFDDRRLVAA